MTVLAIARDENTIALAADGQMTGGGLVLTDSFRKIWRHRSGCDDWLFAGTGSVRSIQVMQYQFAPPHGDESNAMRFMVGTFVPAMRSVLQAAGLEHKSNEVARAAGVALIAARRGHIFAISNDYCVVQITESTWADGSGQAEALGAMFACGKSKAAKVARVGVEAAIKYDAFCSGDIQVETIPA